MNLIRIFSGCLKALGRDTDWASHFDISERGFRASFFALLLSLPMLYVGYAAVVKQRQSVLEANPELAETMPALISAPMLWLLLIIYGMMFPLTAYILCMVFDKLDRFRPWVIARLWSFFFIALAIGALFGLTLLGVLTFAAVLTPVFVLYMSTLLVDIRLAQKIAGFEWGAAVLAACIITAMGLTVILIGTARLG